MNKTNKVNKTPAKTNKNKVRNEFKIMFKSLYKSDKFRSLNSNQIRHNTKIFNKFLKNFKTNNQFIQFMDNIDINRDDDNDKNIEIFRKEYKTIFKNNLTYNRLFKYLLYNDNPYRSVFTTVINKWFKKIPKKYNIKIHNPQARSLGVKPTTIVKKGNNIKKLNKPKKVKKYINVETTLIGFSIKNEGISLRKGYITQFIPTSNISTKNKPLRHLRKGQKLDHKRIKETKKRWDTIKTLVSEQECERHYGVFQSYFYKTQAENNKKMLSSYPAKKQAENKIKKRRHRIEKLQEQHNLDFIKVWNYALKVTGRIDDTSTNYKKDDKNNYDRILSIAFQKLKNKKFQELHKLIDNKHLKSYTDKLCKKYIKTVDKAINSWNSV